MKDVDAQNFTVSIGKADPAVTVDTPQNIVCGVGTFTEPDVKGVDGNTLAGALTYDGNTYADTAESLKAKTNGSTGSIGYTFIPDDTTNYKNATGTINYTMIDVAFKVGDETATAENAVTVKATPTYGDTWAEILTLNTGLKAVLLDETVTTGFSFDVTGSPDAGDDQPYKVLFNGTIGGKTFTNYVVATGTVDVGKKEIDEIVITDITAPAAKETLDTSASTSTTGCDLSAVSWTYGDTSVTEAEFDKAYTAKVVVTADSNHTFGSSLTAKVNGETASVTNNGDGTVTVTYTFAKTTYEVGDTLDLTGGKITVSYNNGTSVDIDINGTMIEGFDSTTAGEKTVTVKYSGFTTSFKVTVSKGSFTVEPQPGNMDGAAIDMPVDELNDAVLTPEDKALIDQGVDIAVLMTVITINPETVPANDVTAIDNVMGDFELGCYIDVELFKRYSNGNPDVPVTNTNAPITISFKVPADILAQYPVSEYEYTVFCSHNGVGYKPLPKATASKNSIKLTWEAVPEAEKYAIYKYVDGKAVKLTETKKLSVKIGKLILDTEYKYIVRAYVDGKWTTMLKSDIVTVKTKAE